MNFVLEVYNTLPKFILNPLNTVEIPNNSTFKHAIDYIADDDDHLITVTVEPIN